jgi:hypothetical protein
VRIGQVVLAEERRQLAQVGPDVALAGGAVEGDLLRERLQDRVELGGSRPVGELDGEDGVAPCTSTALASISRPMTAQLMAWARRNGMEAGSAAIACSSNGTTSS